MADSVLPDVSSRPPVALVGAGAVGTALAHRLREKGYPVAAILSRSVHSARALAAAAGAATASNDLGDLPEQATLVILCVPDGQVRPVAQALATVDHPWTQCLALHTSGALPASVLRPLARAGATPLSFHPLQAFAEGTPPAAFAGIYVGLEGPAEAVGAGCALAEALGAHPLPLSEAAKGRYHLAASIASNFLITLVGMAGDMLDDIIDSRKIDAGTGAEALRPLVEGTLRNLHDRPPEAALTGPIVRGDGATVATHLDMLRRHYPGALPAYVALATETARLAVRAGRLPPDRADRLLKRLAGAAADARRPDADAAEEGQRG